MSAGSDNKIRIMLTGTNITIIRRSPMKLTVSKDHSNGYRKGKSVRRF